MIGKIFIVFVLFLAIMLINTKSIMENRSRARNHAELIENHAEIMETLNDPMYRHCRVRGQVGGEL